jgi:hypothetical protein
MSELDIQIEFDRADRTYRGGEPVTGNVTVRAREDVRCRSLRLEYYWQTHGRGNTDSGDRRQIQLAEGTIPAGHRETFPFRFSAPAGPPTYRGDYLNIDHYVQVRADVRWAFDPKAEEEFIVVPGSQDDGSHVPVIRDDDDNQRAGLIGKLGIGGSIGLIILGCFCFFPFGFILIPVGAVFLVLSLRNVLAERKLGQVSLFWGDRRVPPGGKLPMSIRFTPRKSVHVNEITAKLTSKEVCVSGSGTNKTTHTNTLIEQDWRLTGAQQFQAHQNVRVDYSVRISDIAAYSFDASDNNLKWEISVRVDIPNWPDWTKTTSIVVVPVIDVAVPAETIPKAPIIEAELVGTPVPATIVGAGAAALAAPITPASPAKLDDPDTERPSEPDLAPRAQPAPPVMQESVTQAPESTREHVAEAAHEPEPKVPANRTPESIEEPQSDQESNVAPLPPPEPPGPSLKKVFAEVLAANKFGDDRDNIVRDNDETVFTCYIDVDSITRSYGYDVGQEYLDGRTITGKLAGSDYAVFVLFRGDSNEKLDAIKTGERVEVQCQLFGWDRLYDRLKLREV